MLPIGSHQFPPFIYRFIFAFFPFVLFFRPHTYVKSYGISLSLPDAFHLAQYPLGPSILSQMARSHFFLWISYNIFIHLSIDGHLGCFHILAIVNSSTIDIGVHILLSFSLGKYITYPCQHLLFIVFDSSHPDGVRWYLIMVLFAFSC